MLFQGKCGANRKIGQVLQRNNCNVQITSSESCRCLFGLCRSSCGCPGSVIDSLFRLDFEKQRAPCQKSHRAPVCEQMNRHFNLVHMFQGALTENSGEISCVGLFRFLWIGWFPLASGSFAAQKKRAKCVSFSWQRHSSRLKAHFATWP